MILLLTFAVGAFVGWYAIGGQVLAAILIGLVATAGVSTLAFMRTQRLGSWWDSYTPMEKFAGACRGIFVDSLIRSLFAGLAALITYLALSPFRG